MTDFIKAILHPDIIGMLGWLYTLGFHYIGVLFIIFAESGLLIGFFLPGDSLLFTAGLLATPISIQLIPGLNGGTEPLFNIWTLVIGAWIAAVAGDNVGYEFGKRVGRNLFKKEKSLLFNPENVMKAQEFYEKHGGKSIVIARFIPIVRTFAPIVAGIGNMDHKKFTLFNLIGGTAWTFGLTFAGYFLGNIIPADQVDKYLLPIIIGIVLFSVLPPLYHFYKENSRTMWEKLWEKIRRFFKYQI